MDFDQELLDEFVAESKEHLETIEDDFLAMEHQGEELDADVVAKVFRAIHSVKGAAGFFGLTHIGELAHKMETLLSLVREGDFQPDALFTDTMLQGVDRLNAMLNDIGMSNDMAISDVLDKLDSLLEKDTDEVVHREVITEVPVNGQTGLDLGFLLDEYSLKRLPTTNGLFVLHIDLHAIAETFSPVALLGELSKAGEVVDVHIDAQAEDLGPGFLEAPLRCDLLYDTCLDREMAAMAAGIDVDQVEEIDKAQLLAEPPDNRESDPEKTVQGDAKQAVPQDEGDSGSKAALAASGPSQSSTIRVNVDILNQLMLLAGELVLVRNQQLLMADRSDSFAHNIVQRLDIVTSELQETIMKTRLQPIGNIFNKFPRIVRDLGRKLEKRIELRLHGNEVELDKTILENLADPLTHLVRNCCDHGIELSTDREKAGKPAQGTINLRAYHEAGQINIRIEDDGKGINPDTIRKKALERGLKTESELTKMSDEELASLILLPGFSTVEQISDISGRGVGMDVVKTGIEKLGGSLDLHSQYGEGTTVHLRLPLTLAIIPCLIVQTGDHRYAIPQINLDELVCLYDRDVLTRIEYADDREVYRLRGNLLTMVRLQEVLGRPEPFTEEVRSAISMTHQKSKQGLLDEYDKAVADNEPLSRFRQSVNFAVVKVGNTRFGLIIDRVLGTEEIVVKPMHPALKSLNCYSGATVMGDGKVALILDIEGIAKHAGIALGQRMAEAVASHAGDDVQTVLLFKSGDKERFAVTLPLVRRIEKIPMSDVEVVGDREFVTVDDISTRVVRLDQILKVSPCRDSEEMFLLLPLHTKRPYGILFSELIDIAQAPVMLNVESYQEDGLLGTALIEDEMTLFVDIYRAIELAEPDWFAEQRSAMPPHEERTRVLLAEDASFFRQLVKGYLESAGYVVTVACDGQEALALLEEGEFDLIVSDIEMPRMDGYQFIREARKRDRYVQTPALALTALEAPSDRRKAFENGFDEHEVKIDREGLLHALARLLREKGPVRP